MPSTAQMVSKGFAISFTNWTAKLLDVDGPGFKREALEITNQSTTAGKEYTPSPFYNNEPFQTKFQVNDTDNFKTLITGSTATFTLTYPIAVGRSSAATWAISAMLTDIAPTGALGTIVTGSATWQPTGDGVFTAGS